MAGFKEDFLHCNTADIQFYSPTDDMWFPVIDKTGLFKTEHHEDVTDDPLFLARRNYKQKNGSIIHSKGDVGYGVFYTEDFKADYESGASVYHMIICPDTTGCLLEQVLYLTSTNRTAKGVEAFISYTKQDKFVFKVFDWAQKDHWQLSIPHKKLQKYLTVKSVNDSGYQVIHIVNSTYQSGKNMWTNEVLLKNIKNDRFDKVYKYDYSCTLEEQKSDFVGSWDPIIETFQKSHPGLKEVGFLDVRTSSRNKDNKWSEWKRLDVTDCTFRDDKVGILLKHLEPNHTFICSAQE